MNPNREFRSLYLAVLGASALVPLALAACQPPGSQQPGNTMGTASVAYGYPPPPGGYPPGYPPPGYPPPQGYPGYPPAQGYPTAQGYPPAGQQPPPGYPGAQTPPPGYPTAPQGAPPPGAVPPGPTPPGSPSAAPAPLAPTDPSSLQGILQGIQGALQGTFAPQSGGTGGGSGGGTGGVAPGGIADLTDAGLKAMALKVAPNMQPEGDEMKQNMTQGQHAVIMLTLQAGKCYTLVGFSAPGAVTDIDLNLLAPPLYMTLAGQDLSHNNMPTIGAAPSPMCPVIALPLQYKLDVFAKQGSGTVAVQLFSKPKS